MADGQYDDPIYLSQLKKRIPEEGRNLLAGVTEAHEAWRTLEYFYGNRQMIIATVVEQLLTTQLRHASPHRNFEQMCQAVQVAISALTSVNAEADLHNDQRLVAALIAKLPQYYILEWDRHNAFYEPYGQPTWSKFVRWCTLTRQIAFSARARETQEAVYKANLGTGGGGGSAGGGGGGSAGGGGGGRGRPGGGGLSSFAALAGDSQDSRSKLLKTEEGCKVLREQDREKVGTCPACEEAGVAKVYHTYERYFPAWKGKLDWPSGRLAVCPTFIHMVLPERGRLLKQLTGCGACSSWMHSTDKCSMRTPPVCNAKEGGVECGGKHFRVLHGGGTYISAGAMLDGGSQVQEGGVPRRVRATTEQGSKGGGATVVEAVGLSCGLAQLPPAHLSGCGFLQHPALLATHHIPALAPSGQVLINALSDEGSQITLVAQKAVDRLQLGPGQPWTMFLQVVGSQFREVPTKLYTLRLVDRKGEVRTVTAASVSSVASCGRQLDLQPLKELFPTASEAAFQRPKGEIDLLIGSCNRSLLPSGVLEMRGDLALEETLWGGGQVFRGSHPLLGDTCPAPGLSVEAQTATCCFLRLPSGGSIFTGLSLQGHGEGSVEIEDLVEAKADEMGFIEAEELGTRPRPRCPEHVDCPSCAVLMEGMSRKEQEVILRMHREMKVEGGRVTIAYPWDPKLLRRMRSNRRQALITQDRIRKEMSRKGHLEDFDKEIRKQLEVGSVSIVSEGEIKAWEQQAGPIHYLTLFGVSQPSHAGHKLRVVSNMKMKNIHSGLSPNDCMDRPPNALVALLSVLLWWRTSLHCALVDISRAYQTVLTGPTERFMRLALWKPSEDKPWVVLGYNTMCFGDQAAAAGLELAKAEVSRLGAAVDSHTAAQIARKMYVDDGALAAGTRRQLEEMRGVRSQDGTYSGLISKVLATVGMAPKFVAIPGTATPEEVELLGGKVLGVGYCILTDQLTFKLTTRASVRESGRRKKVTVEWSRKEVEEMRLGTKVLTLRMVLSWTMGLFTPMGLISPFTLRAKLMLRRLQGKGKPVPWDKDMPLDEKQRWGELLMEVLDNGVITFARAAAPPEGADVEIVAFADGSLEAFCAAVYVVWKQPGAQETYGSALVMAKSRLTPLTGTTIPRSELSGLVVAYRLALLVVTSANFRADSLSILTDSECSIALTRKTGGVLRPFSANRVGEIEDLAKELRVRVGVLEPLAAVPGGENPADLGTRGRVSLADLEGERWQTGPSWLRGPRSSWPTTTALSESAPVAELRSSCTAGRTMLQRTAGMVRASPQLAAIQPFGLFELCNPSLLSTQALRSLHHQTQASGKVPDRDGLVSWVQEVVSPKPRRLGRRQCKPVLVQGPQGLLLQCCLGAAGGRRPGGLDQHQAAWEDHRRGQEAGGQPPGRSQAQDATDGVNSWGGRWARLSAAVRGNLDYTNCWTKAQRITARTCRLLFKTPASWCVAVPGCRGALAPEEVEAARRLQFLVSAPASLLALRSGKLQSLGAVEVQGEVFVTGRVQPDELRAVLGIATLRVIMPTERLAYLVLQSCHKEDHRRDVRDCLARSRRVCWIPQARFLARSIISSCLVCRREEKRTQKQAMGMLPSFTSPQLAPFVACGVDLMGPYVVHELKNKSIKNKTWVVAYTCFSTKASAFFCTTGYSAADFLRAHSRFTNTYGPVSLCLVDHGSNLLAAAFRPDWRRVSEAVGMAGTRWLVTPKGAAWRNGQAERHIGMCKAILHRILGGHAFSGSFEELEALLSRCAWILNSRPLAVRTFTDSDFALLCPNDVLLGRAGRVGQPEMEGVELEDVTLAKSLTHMETVARAFYRAVVKETFAEMIPRRKWRWQERNSRVGDICFLVYPSKFGKPWYRPCRVVQVHPDLQGTVRTVTVAFRPRRGLAVRGGPGLVPVEPDTMLVPVQRLATMLPVEEQGTAASSHPVPTAVVDVPAQSHSGSEVAEGVEEQQGRFMDEARRAAALLEEEAQLERQVEEASGGTRVRPRRRSRRIQAMSAGVLVLHDMEQGLQRQLREASWLGDGAVEVEEEEK